ncbi:VOC family protein [Nocardioides psychrotolerans]|uniref:VOC family protein n=1 Tax=Nocardioides psychrotolerans TaxID=1005945 RepID=UPI003137C20A
MSPCWVSAFLDLAAPDLERDLAFWSAVTGYDVSPRRGATDEFATLVPPEGDDFLRVQRRDEGPSRIHLDLHVSDPGAATEHAVALGAQVVHRSEHGYVVLTSPAGLTFCHVSHPARTRPRPRPWPGGGSSLVDQVCLDVAAPDHEREWAFWRDLTGWELVAASFEELHSLVRPAGQPLRFLLQRTDDARGTPPRIHLDLATSDRTAETRRHVGLGARVLSTHDRWTVLADPGGSSYCLTDRDPATGLLP